MTLSPARRRPAPLSGSFPTWTPPPTPTVPTHTSGPLARGPRHTATPSWTDGGTGKHNGLRLLAALFTDPASLSGQEKVAHLDGGALALFAVDLYSAVGLAVRRPAGAARLTEDEFTAVVASEVEEVATFTVPATAHQPGGEVVLLRVRRGWVLSEAREWRGLFANATANGGTVPVLLVTARGFRSLGDLVAAAARDPDGALLFEAGLTAIVRRWDPVFTRDRAPGVALAALTSRRGPLFKVRGADPAPKVMSARARLLPIARNVPPVSAAMTPQEVDDWEHWARQAVRELGRPEFWQRLPFDWRVLGPLTAHDAGTQLWLLHTGFGFVLGEGSDGHRVRPIHEDVLLAPSLGHMRDRIGARLDRPVRSGEAEMVALRDAFGGIRTVIAEALDDPEAWKTLLGLSMSTPLPARCYSPEFGCPPSQRQSRGRRLRAWLGRH